MTSRAKTAKGKTKTFNAYPLVPIGTVDYERWAADWAAQKGWVLLEVLSQAPARREKPTHFQLKLLLREGTEAELQRLAGAS